MSRQIPFEARVTRKDMREESICDRVLRMQEVDHLRRRDDQHLCSGHGRRGLRPGVVSVERFLAQEPAGFDETADRVLAVGRPDREPDAADLDVQHAVTCVALKENHPALSVSSDGEGCPCRLEYWAEIQRRMIEQGRHGTSSNQVSRLVSNIAHGVPLHSAAKVPADAGMSSSRRERRPAGTISVVQTLHGRVIRPWGAR